MSPDRVEFSRLVREALNHLYDSRFLDVHELVNVLVSEDKRTDRPGQELRRILLSAIHQLYQDEKIPDQSRDWRSYQILELRFVAGQPSNEVIQRLAISRSLFFVEQARAIDALVNLLWPRRIINLPEDTHQVTSLDMDVRNLLQRARWETIDLSEVVQGIQPVLNALAQSQNFVVEYSLQANRLIPHADRILLRQLIISLVSWGLHGNQGTDTAHPLNMGDLPGIEDASTLGRGKISIMISECQAPSLLIRIQPSGQVQAEPFESSQPDLVAPSSRVLLEAMGGKLDVWHNPGEINLECSWSVPSSPLLLVIDDDPDFIELVRRFLANSTWKVSGVVDGESTREFLKTCLPDVILLDVILPREDGWELLLSLKTDPATQNIPVIVCSALNEPGLVHALGGAQALLKPISRASLLDALHPWAAPSQE